MSQSTSSVSGDPLNMLATAAASSSSTQPNLIASELKAIEISSGALRDVIRQTDREYLIVAAKIEALSQKISNSNQPDQAYLSLQTLVGRLTTDLTDQQKKLADAVTLIQSVRLTVSSHQNKLDKTVDDLMNASINLLHLEKKEADFQATIRNMNTTIQNLQNSIDILKNANASTEDAQKTLSSSIQATQSEIGKIENSRQTTQSELAILKEKYRELKISREQTINDIASDSSRIEGLEKNQISALKSAIFDQEKVVAEKTKQLKEAETNKQVQLHQWTQDLENANKELSLLKEKAEALRLGISLLERQSSSRQLPVAMEIDSDDDTEDMPIVNLAQQAAASSSSAPSKKRPLETVVIPTVKRPKGGATIKEMVKNLALFHPPGTILQYYNDQVKIIKLLDDAERELITKDFLVESMTTKKQYKASAQHLNLIPEVDKSYFFRDKLDDSLRRFYCGKVLKIKRSEKPAGFQRNLSIAKVQWLESKKDAVELTLNGLDSVLPMRDDLMEHLVSERVEFGDEFLTAYSLV